MFCSLGGCLGETDISRTEVDNRMLVFKLERNNGSVVLVPTLYSFTELLRAIQLGVPYHVTMGDKWRPRIQKCCW